MGDSAVPREPNRPPGPDVALQRHAQMWLAASERLFASGMSSPETYARTTRLVGEVLTALRQRGDRAEDLVEAWDSRGTWLGDVVDPHIVASAGVDTETLAAGAFAMRYREVAPKINADRRRRAWADLPSDSAWATLEESGFARADPFMPYERVDVELSSGRAIRVTTRASDDFSSTIHEVATLHFAPDVGELSQRGDGAGTQQPREFSTVDECERYVQTLKDRPIG